jgi:hypothetical protein
LLKDTLAETVIADKAYDASERLIEPLRKLGKGIVFPNAALSAKSLESTTVISTKHGT